MLEKINEILDFWFGSHSGNRLKNANMWWQEDPKWDKTIKDKFLDLHRMAIEGQLEHWKEQPKSCLAYILLLDQFSRNMFRNTPNAYKQDPLALQATLEGLEHKFNKDLNLIERLFFFMPLMHSEDIQNQNLSVALFLNMMEEAQEMNSEYLQQMKSAYKAALEHQSLILSFGRFPKRNAILNRDSTQGEKDYLSNGN